MNNFIRMLDELYEKEMKKYKSSNNFILFTPVIIEQEGKVNDVYLIRKQEFTKYLYCKNGARVYFTDADILEMLLQIREKETMCSIINSLAEMYRDNGTKFTLQINEKKYDAKGLPLIQDKQMLKNRKDIDISFEDLQFLINIILAKDKASIVLWKDKPDFQRQTIVKYIVLLKFYYYNDVNAKEYLQQNGYDIDSDIHHNYNTKEKREKKNKTFCDFILFEKLNII